MKKQNNIFNYTRQAASFILISILFNACIEEDITPKREDVVEGIPVEVNLNINVPGMQKVTTRGLSDAEEFQVNDLYVFVFDANSKRTKEGTGYYKDEIEDAFTGSQNGTTSTGKITLKTTSGESIIYGVANVGGNDLGGDLKSELDQISSLDALKAYTVKLSKAGNVDRITATLVMSGAYEDSQNASPAHETGYCVISSVASGNTLKGTIKLTRLDSHITFKINPLMKGSTLQVDGERVEGKILSFTPTSWKVYNVPVTSYLTARDQDAMSKAEDYAPTNENIIKPSANNEYSFDFYMLENRKNNKSYNGEDISDYSQREAEEKAAGMNTGIYKYVEPYATYVEIKAHIELEQEGTDDGRRIADVTYVVHLGYVNNDSKDFKSLRNKKYTYNISIINVNSIVAEVENGDESQPGAEGAVVDSQTKIYNLDCHYGYIILGFTYEEVKDGLNFYVKTPYGETTQDNSNEKNKHDYKWLKFKRNQYNSSSTLEIYPEYGNDLIDLFGLAKDIQTRYESSYGYEKTFYYTVFIDEYYYEQHPCGTETWTRAKWEEFTNTDNRYALLLFKPKYSTDQESSYAGAKFMITQKSIQTYYSNSETALGMEHENETGKPECYSGNYGSSATYGYANIYDLWSYMSLSKCVDQTRPSNNTFAMNSRNRNAVYDCMSRNRDEDGDGYIKGKEIKWYLPATQQLVGMFLGAESLTTPLFSNADQKPYSTDKYTEGTYHYVTSDNKRIWSEEGASFGDVRVDYASAPEKLRCVRNLGVNAQLQVDNHYTNYIGNVYKYDKSTRILRMSYMDTRSIRTSKAINAELGLHHNFSSTNRPFTAFQIAKDVISVRGKGIYEANTWINLVKMDMDKLNRSVCANYSESDNDIGTWRAPNQRELMLMYMADNTLVKGDVRNNYWEENIQPGSYTRTAWKFNESYHFSVSSNQMYMDRGGADGSYIRCVRDVD